MVKQVVEPGTEVPTGQRSQEVILRTYDLSKDYRQRRVVNRLNLEVHKGEIFGFLGPNGAGKTTSIRMILGLISMNEGRVEIFGKDLHTQKADILPHVGALVETPALYLYLSGRDNLIAFAAALGGVPKSRFDEVLELVNLSTRQHDKVRTYSLGMKQRLGVAVALLQNPDLLILDEPANGLDPAGIVEMRDFMHRLVNNGKTIIFSSHLLTEVQQICTHVGIINQGQLITETSVADLLHGGGEFAVELERKEEALMVVRDEFWGRKAYIDSHGLLQCASPDGQGRSLNRFLMEKGFVADSLARSKQDLEQVFLDLTNGVSGE